MEWIKGLLQNRDLISIEKDILILGNTNIEETQAELEYIKVREKEKRILTKVDIKMLPKSSVHTNEWKMRSKSATRLINYLSAKEIAFPILDLGCGNGWFSNMMQKSTNAPVLGLDLNAYELRQAANIFNNDKMYFCYGDIEKNLFLPNSFEIIVLNASVQYFKHFPELLNLLLKLLSEEGEIHILDSPFYESELKANEAKLRSIKYYNSIGEASFAAHYHHRTWVELQGYDYSVKYKKGFKQLFYTDSPFPWIRIGNK